MTFTVKTQNLGSLPESPVEIGGLTLLAGPNATGKSFLCKALYSIFTAVNAKQGQPDGFRSALRQSLLGNFQVGSLSELKKDPGKPITIEVGDAARIVIAKDGKDGIEAEALSPGLMGARRHSSIFYLESPVFWKLRGALRAAGGSLDAQGAMDVPRHFQDLALALGRKRAGEPAFPQVLARICSQEVLGGQLAIDEGGSLVFVEAKDSSSRPLPLPLAAAGALNLGMVALLIERRLLDKDAFLFIDAPEASLHPQWQVEMAKALLELAKGGVHVVIATHSGDIVERLFGLVNNRQGLESLVALNHFSNGSAIVEGQTFQERIDKILGVLNGPYSDSYLISEGLRDG